ncbi:hypothetical protein E8L90_29555 [Brevibacillus antibioticus]|uniref:Uncharacterized protein n=1 Tax=Brevibacillus antibioticus TaxID=2570228 RepID=A0A4U2YEA5_9BACL|nr:hypothetical protein [Brevibacillus antibioticus]TKI59218.1 hypothetical protein E8L90_29555 [Brevibacillus antibioticus]
MMKKMIPLCIGLVFVVMIGPNVMADKGIPQLTDSSQKYQSETLDKLGIRSTNMKNDSSSFSALDTVVDDEGKEWIYVSYLHSNLIEEQIKEKYSRKVSTSFIEVQEQILDPIIQEGDTLPVLLVNEDLTFGKMAYLQEEGNGDLILATFELDEDNQQWVITQKAK